MRKPATKTDWVRKYILKNCPEVIEKHAQLDTTALMAAAKKSGVKFSKALAHTLVWEMRKKHKTTAIVPAKAEVVVKKPRNRTPTPVQAVEQLKNVALQTQQFIKHLGFAGLVIPAEGQISISF